MMWTKVWNGAAINLTATLFLVWVNVLPWWLLSFALLAVVLTSVMLDGEESW